MSPRRRGDSSLDLEALAGPLRTLGSVVGQERALAVLRDAAARGRLHHALLFVGPEGVGKRTVARSFGARLLCARGGDDLCGACASCREIEAGTHPDLNLVTLLLDDEGKPRQHVLIEQVLELQSRLALRAARGGKKVAIVDEAQSMTAEAQNAFLKTLEEPPGDTLLVLVAHNLAGVLPTVRSRCQVVQFAPLAAESIEAILVAGGWTPDDARLVSFFSDGGLGGAGDVEPAKLQSAYERVRAAREAATRGRFEGIVEAAREMVPGPRQAAVELDCLVRLVRADLRAAAGVCGAGDLTRAVKTGSLEAALDAAEAAYQAVVDLDGNANRQLALERMWLRLAAADRRVPHG